jgi:diadenosine tetraphosphate (Ap4A) HIT family hydrolase
MSVSNVGFYDDSRFPGRLILSLEEHFEHIEDVPEDLANLFMRDIQQLARDMRTALTVDRVNVAILGNQEPHVHAHLIPRSPSAEPLPNKSPWNDPRPKNQLPENERLELISSLTTRLLRTRPATAATTFSGLGAGAVRAPSTNRW